MTNKHNKKIVLWSRKNLHVTHPHRQYARTSWIAVYHGEYPIISLSSSCWLYLWLHHLPLYWFSDWLERTMLETKPAPKVVTVVNPGKPSGTYIPEPLLQVNLSLSFSLTCPKCMCLCILYLHVWGHTQAINNRRNIFSPCFGLYKF